MTTYGFDVTAVGDWTTAADWVNDTTGKPNDGVPGAGDTALIYSDAAVGPTTLTTFGETVAVVEGNGTGTSYLIGSGLTVTGSMSGLVLGAGDYSVEGFAGAVAVQAGATLSGGTIGQATGGVSVEGGTVKSSNSFWGALSSGSVTTNTLFAADVSGGTLTATAMKIASSAALIVSAGVAVAKQSVVVTSAGLPAGVSISGGVFTDEGSLILGGQVPSQTIYRGSFSVSGGTQAVDGATNVANYGELNVSGKGTLRLLKALNVGMVKGATGYVDVGSPIAAGGDLVISGGNTNLGGAGNAAVLVFWDGKIDATLSNVTVGAQATSNSTLTIESGGSMIAKGLIVAHFGQASVNVNTKGSLTVEDTLVIDGGAGANGTVSVTGAGSKITAAGLGGTGTLTVGDSAILDITNTGAASSTMSFSGAAELLLLRAEDFHSAIDNFGKGDSVILSGFGALSQPIGFHENTAGTIATLTLTDGGRLAHLVFDGDFVQSDFHYAASTSRLTFV